MGSPNDFCDRNGPTLFKYYDQRGGMAATGELGLFDLDLWPFFFLEINSLQPALRRAGCKVYYENCLRPACDCIVGHNMIINVIFLWKLQPRLWPPTQFQIFLNNDQFATRNAITKYFISLTTTFNDRKKWLQTTVIATVNKELCDHFDSWNAVTNFTCFNPAASRL